MSLLQEAIVDMKAVKAMAYANAKMALEETFKPSIQRLVSSKIAEEEGDEEEDVELDIDSAPDFEGEDFDSEEPAVGFSSLKGDGGEDEMSDDDFEDDEIEDDEIEEAVRSFMEADEMDFEDSELDEIFEGEEMDFEDSELEEEFDEDEIEEIFEGDEMDFDGDIEEEFDEDELEEIFESSRYSERNERELKRIKAKLNEALRSNVIYKKAINEVNLLNAKLMYSQKVMQEYELTKDQKVKVLEAFDRANTVRDVQGKYRDIVSLMKGKKITKSINEGAASRPIRQLNKPITRIDESVNRFKVLAGLKPAYE